MPARSAADSSFAEQVLGQTLVFRAGQEWFGLPLKVVLEVLELDLDPVPVPAAPDWLAGLLNHHGRVLPAIRAAVLLGVEPAEAPGRQLLLVELGVERAALLVEQILSLEEVRSEGPRLSGGHRRAWLRGTLLTLLDPESLARLLHERARADRPDGERRSLLDAPDTP